MGTSGSYGGSTRKGWKKVHENIDGLNGGKDDSGFDSSKPGNEDTLGDIWQDIANALNDDDPSLAKHPQTSIFSLSDLLPRARASHVKGSGVGGGSVGLARGETGSAGRRGSRSTRELVKGAARGANAIGGAYALLSGNVTELSELGLDLSELKALSPRMQCARILEAVIGNGSHPDDIALRKASYETLKDIIVDGQPPSEVDALRGFISNYIFQISLVEIEKRLVAGSIGPTEALKDEKMMKAFLDSKVRILSIPSEGKMSLTKFREIAERLTRDAIGLLRAEEGTP